MSGITPQCDTRNYAHIKMWNIFSMMKERRRWIDDCIPRNCFGGWNIILDPKNEG